MIKGSIWAYGRLSCIPHPAFLDSYYTYEKCESHLPLPHYPPRCFSRYILFLNHGSVVLMQIIRKVTPCSSNQYSYMGLRTSWRISASRMMGWGLWWTTHPKAQEATPYFRMKSPSRFVRENKHAPTVLCNYPSSLT